MSKPGNSSGKNKYWLSVKDCSTGSLHSLDFENIDESKKNSHIYAINIQHRIRAS